jgi:hypothetical protein
MHISAKCNIQHYTALSGLVFLPLTQGVALAYSISPGLGYLSKLTQTKTLDSSLRWNDRTQNQL